MRRINWDHPALWVIIPLTALFLIAAVMTHRTQALEQRIYTLEQELANEELFSEYVRLELAWEQRRIPVCQEDATLIGVGDFTSTSGISGGTWDAYQCYLSVDDYETPGG